MAELMSLIVNRLSHSAAFQNLRREWEELDSGLTNRTPFTSPIWNELWWKHFSRSGLLRHDEFFIHEVRKPNGELFAIAPLMRTCEPNLGPIRARKVQFFGTDPSLTEIRGIISKAEHQRDALSALAKHFSEKENNWDVFKWSGVRAEAVVQLPLGKLRTERLLPDYIVNLPGRWQDLHSTLSNNTRKSIRKGYEFLERDGHQPSLRVAESLAGDDEILRRFFRLHQARSSAEDMKQHRDNFHTAQSRRFLDDVIGTMGSRGLVRIFELEVSGEIVASRIAFGLGRDIYLYFSGFEPSWKKYGVMTTLVVEIIKWAIERGFNTLNLSTGRDQSKLRWLPTETVLHDIVQSTESVRSQLIARSELWRRGALKELS
ncbi:GNAT family N-acetyltransferase [Bradyrhizobium sp. CIAT3101]|uniref:GNAT family N-acetyltransferase n=1 Tax=Bradyrhizobium sp. CIAT3101 TaxID=439387 RepID=UPI0024B27B86|nr:GNAT family N-acetyltransferase [Bradyrhizobium sp. CIAT3101]WFU79151.1 GNAT family N-acetyltransferase [Bradyrhizobium sp. CIAT3101]